MRERSTSEATRQSSTLHVRTRQSWTHSQLNVIGTTPFHLRQATPNSIRHLGATRGIIATPKTPKTPGSELSHMNPELLLWSYLHSVESR